VTRRPRWPSRVGAGDSCWPCLLFREPPQCETVTFTFTVAARKAAAANQREESERGRALWLRK
jgi:hypothetical protein